MNDGITPAVTPPAATPPATTPPAATPPAAVAPAATPPAGTPPVATPPVVTPPVTTPPATVPPADSTQLETPAWMVPFSAEAQEAIRKNNWKDPNEIIKSYTELRTELSKRGIQQPKADAPKTEWDAYYKALGRPDKAADYAFTLPQDVPPDMPYDAKFADSFKNWAHDIGLTPGQAQQMHDRYVKNFAEQLKAGVGELNQKITESHTELVNTWGQPGTEKYNKNVEMATRAVRNLDPGLAKALKEANLLTADGTVLSAALAKSLAKVGTELYAEDSLYGAGQLVTDQNPWTKGKENLTRQGEIYKQDPARARELQRAAGLKVTL